MFKTWQEVVVWAAFVFLAAAWLLSLPASP